MTEVLRTPESRVCERCGRVERHDEEVGGWRAADAGDVYCIHEWDIDGEFVPVQDAAPVAE
jgi:hypothetical protein